MLRFPLALRALVAAAGLVLASPLRAQTPERTVVLMLDGFGED